MTSPGDVADTLDRHKRAVRALVAKYHATRPRVFGSALRGEAKEGSDLDFLVDYTAEASLLDEVGLRLALTDLLEVDVDVVGADTLRGEVREHILSEAVAL